MVLGARVPLDLLVLVVRQTLMIVCRCRAETMVFAMIRSRVTDANASQVTPVSR